MILTRLRYWSVIVATLLATPVVAITLFYATVLLGHYSPLGDPDHDAVAFIFGLPCLFGFVAVGFCCLSFCQYVREYGFAPLNWLRKKAEAEEKLAAEVRADITRDANALAMAVLESLELRFDGAGKFRLFCTDGHGDSYSVAAPEWLVQSRPMANGNIIHELRQRKFRDGQWVRVTQDSDDPLKLGVLGQVDYTSGYLGVRVRADGAAYGIFSDHLEPALPRRGEIWTFGVCTDHGQMYSSPRPFNFNVEPGSVYAKWVGCCLNPVNFGRPWPEPEIHFESPEELGNA